MGIPGWLSGLAPAFGPGWSPTSGSLHGACFSLCLCLCLALSLSVSLMNKETKSLKKQNAHKAGSLPGASLWLGEDKPHNPHFLQGALRRLGELQVGLEGCSQGLALWRPRRRARTGRGRRRPPARPHATAPQLARLEARRSRPRARAPSSRGRAPASGGGTPTPPPGTPTEPAGRPRRVHGRFSPVPPAAPPPPPPCAPRAARRPPPGPPPSCPQPPNLSPGPHAGPTWGAAAEAASGRHWLRGRPRASPVVPLAALPACRPSAQRVAPFAPRAPPPPPGGRIFSSHWLLPAGGRVFHAVSFDFWSE